MAYEMRWADNAIDEYRMVVDYLHKEWGEEIAARFIEVMNHKVRQIAINPFIGKVAGKGNNVRSLLITKHNRLHYRFIGEEVIEIAAIFDTRQDPAKNRFE